LSEQLPPGWTGATLGAVADVRAGFGFPKDLQGRPSGELPFAKVGDISAVFRAGGLELDSANHYVDRADLRRLRARPLPAGTVVFAKIGEAIRLNRRAITTRELVVDNNVMALVPDLALVEPRFLLHLMRTISLYEHAGATTVPSVRSSTVHGLPIGLPPINEQRRIVAEVEALEARSRRAHQALDAVPPLLEKLRQSILAAAFRGDLTKDWRAKHKDVEPASKLLKRRVPLPVGYNRLVKREKLSPVVFDERLFPALPKTWCYATVTELYDAGLVVDFADGNHGSEYPRASEFGAEGQIFVTAAQIARGAVDFRACPRLNPKKAAKLRKGWAEGGDVLLTHNATVGRVALVAEDTGRFLLGTSVTFYRPQRTGLLARFLFGAMLSPVWQAQLGAIMAQTTRNQVSIQKQAFFSIPLAPIEEQFIVGDRVRTALARLDELEDTLRSLEVRLTCLDRSILAKAFHGELVPQDPNDEPAEAMLARVREANRVAMNGHSANNGKASARTGRGTRDTRAEEA
jgi:type I restriction enzyme S subunit